MVEWELGGLPLAGRGGGGGSQIPAAEANHPVVYRLFQESGGPFAGNTRGDGWARPPIATTATQAVFQQEEGFPFVQDPISQIEGVPAAVEGGGGGAFMGDSWGLSRTVANGNINAVINGRSFKEQAPNRSGAAKLTGMRIMYNQITYDNSVTIGTYGTDPPEVLSNRIGTRARNISGTNEWFWRPGAPLSLVLDTITPALVYSLPRPITLGPGDTLDVEMNFPGVLSAQYEEDVPFQIGVSLNGFAAIEG
jgi:hypothetical protein